MSEDNFTDIVNNTFNDKSPHMHYDEINIDENEIDIKNVSEQLNDPLNISDYKDILHCGEYNHNLTTNNEEEEYSTLYESENSNNSTTCDSDTESDNDTNVETDTNTEEESENTEDKKTNNYCDPVDGEKKNVQYYCIII